MSRDEPRKTESPRSAASALIRDGLIVIVVTAVCAIVAARMEWNERFFSLTRSYESLQVDELPIVLLVLTLGLIWLSWRRTRDLAVQLSARGDAERRLAEALQANQAFGRQQLHAVEAERRHLAREIHDELGQYLNAIKIDAVTLRQIPVSHQSGHLAACDRIIQVCDHVHAVVSDMIRRLRPVGLDDLGLAAALENCVDHWRQRLSQTKVTLQVRGQLDNLDDTLSLTAYRIVQEGLTNCFKHADARRIDVTVERRSAPDQSQDRLIVGVRDDGKGASLSSLSGFGLVGLRERVQMMGGTFGIQTDLERGFGFLVQLPLDAKAAAAT